MPFYLVLIIFSLGAVIGSFLNVLVDRVPIGENPVKGRSHCDNCKHVLGIMDLIPLVSYATLKGRCRYCNRKLSLYYPFVELVTGLLFAIVAYAVINGRISLVPSSPNSYIIYIIYYLSLISVLIVIFFTDLKSGIIPFGSIVVGLLIVILGLLIFPSDVSFINHFYSALGTFAAFMLLFLVTRGRGIGFGDVVYVFFMGFLLGFPKIILGIYIAFITGAVISLLLIFLKKKKIRGSTIPFGPFLVLGTVICLFWGDFLLGIALPYLLVR